MRVPSCAQICGLRVRFAPPRVRLRSRTRTPHHLDGELLSHQPLCARGSYLAPGRYSMQGVVIVTRQLPRVRADRHQCAESPSQRRTKPNWQPARSSPDKDTHGLGIRGPLSDQREPDSNPRPSRSRVRSMRLQRRSSLSIRGATDPVAVERFGSPRPFSRSRRVLPRAPTRRHVAGRYPP